MRLRGLMVRTKFSVKSMMLSMIRPYRGLPQDLASRRWKRALRLSLMSISRVAWYSAKRFRKSCNCWSLAWRAAKRQISGSK